MNGFRAILVNQVGKVRRASLHGRNYLVAPFTSLGPRVLNGSRGALYYPRNEIEKNPGIWNNVPLTLGHPADPITNTPQSARDPEVLERTQLGFVFNDRIDRGWRKGEAWFDEELTKNKAPEVYKALLASKPIDLSTGLYTDDVVKNGVTEDGQPFDAIATNYRPDHLAVLPHQKGACSQEHGCGIMLNTTNSNPEGHNQYTGGGRSNLSQDSRQASKDAEAATEKATELRTKKAHAEAAVQHTHAASLKKVGSSSHTKHLMSAAYHHAQSRGQTPAGFKSTLNEEPTMNNRFWHRLGEFLGLIHNQGRHGDSGQFLNKSGVSSKQLQTAATRGFGHTLGHEQPPQDDPDDDGDAPEKSFGQGDRDDSTWKEEENEFENAQEVAAINSNPEGHNQYTGGSSSNEEDYLPGKMKEGQALDKSGEEYSKAAAQARKFGFNGTLKSIEKVSDPKVLQQLVDTATQHSKDAEAYGQHGTKALVAGVAKKASQVLRKLSNNVETYPKCKSPLTNGTCSCNEESGTGLAGDPIHVGPTGNGEVSMKLTEKQRADLVGYLTTNCDCWKGKEKILANREVMSDDDIAKFARNAQAQAQQALALNQAKSKGFVFNEKAEGSNADVTGAKGSTEQVGTEEENDQGAVHPSVKAEVPATKPKFTKNEFEAAFKDYFGIEASEAKGLMTTANASANAEKDRLIQLLTSNVRDKGRRDRLTANYRKMTLTEVQDHAAMLPQYLQPTVNMNLIREEQYGAFNVDAIINSDTTNNEDDTLALPVMNWEREVAAA